MHRVAEELDGRLLHRMLFFTDAVFAIAMTLMALELRPPEVGAAAQGAEAMGEMIGHFIAFGMSFGLAAVFWLAHMNTTRRLVRFDWATAVANLAFLLPVCLLPFASAWIGHSFDDPYSWGVYSWVLVACSGTNMIVVLVMCRGRGRLQAGGISPRERAYRLARAGSPGLAFLISLAVLSTGRLHLAQMCFCLIGLNFWLAGVFFKPKVDPLTELEPAA